MKGKIYKAYLGSVVALMVVGLILRDKQILAPTISFAMLVMGADDIVQVVKEHKILSGLHWLKGLALILIGVCSMALWDSIGHATAHASVIVGIEGIFALVALNCLEPRD